MLWISGLGSCIFDIWILALHGILDCGLGILAFLDLDSRLVLLHAGFCLGLSLSRFLAVLGSGFAF